jgi:tRNA U34 2-thiouridine synthase MnmA/TrmU
VIRIENENWLGDARERVSAQYRYHGPELAGTYSTGAFTADEPIPEVIAEGQSLVLYDGDELLGGGIIAR